jgi:hypothetical protein
LGERRLDNWIENYIFSTECTEPPLLFRKWAAISVLASALQRKCFLQWGTLTFYPNMYIVLVAPSGKARKGVAMSSAMEMLDTIDVNLTAEAITREALIRDLNQSSTEDIDAETGEMFFHSSLTIHSQELTVFIGYKNNELLMDLTDWYDCRSRWTYRTKNMGSDEIVGVWVNLFGATTPELLQTTLPTDAIGGGLTSRMIFVYEPKKGQSLVFPFPNEDQKRVKEDLIRDLGVIKALKGKFHVSKDFPEAWAKWYLAQEENPPFSDARFSGYFERRPTHVMKLAMLMNVSRTSSMIIGVQDLESAIELLENTEQKMPSVFAGVGTASHANVLQSVMSRIGLAKQITFGDLVYEFRYDADKWLMSKILETLEISGFCDIIRGQGERNMVVVYKDRDAKDE